MTYPLRHDEQMYLPSGILFTPDAVYRDHGFNHLPNLPILLNAVFSTFGVDHYLLVGRLIICLGWLGIGGAMLAIARRATGDLWLGALGFLLLAGNAVYVGQAGMLVSNNLLPVPFALFGLYFYLRGVDRPRPHPGLVALAGFLVAVAVGFKANYAFLLLPFGLAALFAPAALPFPERLRRVVLPFALGGLIGGLPTLYFLATDPDGFLAHVVRYHTGPHAAWSRAAGESLVLSMGQKLLLAEELWLSGTVLLTVIGVAVFAGTPVRNGQSRRFGGLLSWPILLVVGLVAGGVVVSFVPTPSFPQYYLPPLAFGVVLFMLLHARLGSSQRVALRPLVIAVAAIAAITGGPRLLAGVPGLAAPGRWTGNRVHAAAAEIARQVETRDAGRKVATLSPIYALEGGLEVYPELAAGPFVYRVAELIPTADRRHYRLVDQTSLAARLDGDPPAAIVTGLEGELDASFERYATDRGYERAILRDATMRNHVVKLYLAPFRANK